jgi:hypothetical protein
MNPCSPSVPFLALSAALLGTLGCGVSTVEIAPGDDIDVLASELSTDQVRSNLYLFKRTPSFEVHALTGRSAFQSFSIHSTSKLGDTGVQGNWVFRAGDWNSDGTPDVIGISRASTGTQRTEVHILNGAAGFQNFLLQTGTALEQTGSDGSWDFAVADYNGDGRLDLYAIKKANGGAGQTEIHVLDGASNFQRFLLHGATALHPTGSDNAWNFTVGDFNGDGRADLFAIYRLAHGDDLNTDVHVLNGADNFQSFLLHARSGLEAVGQTNGWEFRAGDYDADGRADLFCLKKHATGSGTTEVHVLGAKSNFSTFLLHSNSGIHETGNTGAWQLDVYSPTAGPTDPTGPTGPTGPVNVPGSLVSLLSPKPYVEQSCVSATYPGWPHPAQRCTYSSGGITTSVTVANPSPDRVGRWIVDSANFIPALAKLKGSAQGQYEEGLKAIGLAMLYQSSRIYPLSGGVIENMGSGYVNYIFENGVTKSCSSGCYCRINSLHRRDWCEFQAGTGKQSKAACLSQVGSSGYTSGWASQCFENHKRAFNADFNEHFRAKAFVANYTVANRCPPGACSPAQVVAAVKNAFGL